MSTENYSDVKISQRLKILVNEISGGNVSRFAGLAQVNTQTFHTYLKGRAPNAETLFNICKNLHVNVNWLLTGEGPKRLKESKEPKENFLLLVDQWLTELKEGDAGRLEWFKYSFIDAFPKFKFWLAKKDSN